MTLLLRRCWATVKHYWPRRRHRCCVHSELDGAVRRVTEEHGRYVAEQQRLANINYSQIFDGIIQQKAVRYMTLEELRQRHNDLRCETQQERAIRLRDQMHNAIRPPRKDDDG